MLFFDQSTNTPLVDGAVHSILKDADQERILVGSKYGITALDPFGDVSSTHELRAGLEMTSMIRWSSSETSDFMIIGTNQGFIVSMENGLPIMSSVSESKIGRVINMLELNTGGTIWICLSSGKIRHGHQFLRSGINGDCWSGGQSIAISSLAPNTELTEILSDAEVSVNDAIQVPMTGRGPLVLLATDSWSHSLEHN